MIITKEKAVDRLSIEELVNKLIENKDENFLLKCEGMITVEFDIKLLKINRDKDYLIIKYGEEKEIKLNTHQIAKIEKLGEKTYIIRFDSLQIVNIIIK